MSIIKNVKIALLKLGVNTLGQLSDGIRLATKEGFISGQMLEYIYENQPRGITFLGRYIDKIFIRHPGWQDVRNRRENLMSVLSETIERQFQTKDSVYLCDVASGPAGYIIDTLIRFQNRKDRKRVFAEIRDLDTRWLDEALKKARALGLDTITVRSGNALEKKDFVFDVTPNVFISSGFYDWMEDDEWVKQSMRLIYDALPVGGEFVFTNQSGHVDLTLTNRVFKDFNHKPLSMKTRPSAVINSWAEEIGFKIQEVKTDLAGHYSVTGAYK